MKCLKDSKVFLLLTFLFPIAIFGQGDLLYSIPVPENQYFYIQSVNNVGVSWEGYWDIPGHPKNFTNAQEQNVQVWKHDSDPDRLYKFVKQASGNYKIVAKHSGNNAALRYDTGNNGNGANVFLDGYNSPGTEFRFEYHGRGLWKILTPDGRIICLSGKSSSNGTNVHLWQNHDAEGTLWGFVTESEKKLYIPNINTGNVTAIQPEVLPGEASKSVVDEMDKTYAEILRMSAKFDKIQNDMGSSNIAFGEVSSISERGAALVKNCGDTEEMVSTFNVIPYLGRVTKGASTLLNKTSGMVNKLTKTLEPFNQAGKGFGELNFASVSIGNDLDLLKANFAGIKKQYVDAAKIASSTGDPGKISAFETRSANALNYLRTLKNDLGQIDKGMNILEKVSDAIAKIKKPMTDADNGIGKAEKVVEKIGNGSRKIDNVLNKQFKKDVKIGVGKLSKTLKIRISVKDILTGKGAFKKLGKLTKKAQDWAMSHIKDIEKELAGEAVDKIPGADDIINKINTIKNDLNELKSKGKEYADFAGKVKSSRMGFENEILGCLKCAS